MTDCLRKTWSWEGFRGSTGFEKDHVLAQKDWKKLVVEYEEKYIILSKQSKELSVERRTRSLV